MDRRTFFFSLPILGAAASARAQGTPMDQPTIISVPSTLDGKPQPCTFIAGRAGAPLLVMLHSWSLDHKEPKPRWIEGCRERGWHYLQPSFRGPNDKPEACASPLARQDILDAVAWVRARHDVDDSRVYLAGESGGGHMTLVMAAHAPGLWAAASAWVPISDLRQWHADSVRLGTKYARMIEQCVGGAPGASAGVDAQLRARSPLFHLHAAAALPIETNAGINDGHGGRSVPVSHTLRAWNAIARAHGAEEIDEATIARLLERDVPEPRANPADFEGFGEKTPLFHRRSRDARTVLFDGGHEGIAEAALAWLEKFRRA